MSTRRKPKPKPTTTLSITISTDVPVVTTNSYGERYESSERIGALQLTRTAHVGASLFSEAQKMLTEAADNLFGEQGGDDSDDDDSDDE